MWCNRAPKWLMIRTIRSGSPPTPKLGKTWSRWRRRALAASCERAFSGDMVGKMVNGGQIADGKLADTAGLRKSEPVRRMIRQVCRAQRFLFARIATRDVLRYVTSSWSQEMQVSPVCGISALHSRAHGRAGQWTGRRTGNATLASLSLRHARP